MNQLKRVPMAGIVCAVLAGLLSPTLQADPIAPPPTTAPTVAVAPVNAEPRVEIFAFSSVNKQDPADWIGRGIQENLQSDVSRTGATLVLPPHGTAASDDPIEAAKANHADLAVVGTYQVVGDQIRVNAHLMDVSTNTAVGGFAATGAQHDLFKVEDALGEQLRRLLPRSASSQQLTQAAQTALAPSEPQNPIVIYQQSPEAAYPVAPVGNYYEPAPYYYPDDGFYGYGYPYAFYGGIGIYSTGYYGGRYSGRGYYGHGSVGVARGPVGRGIGGGGIRGGVGGGGFHGGGGRR